MANFVYDDNEPTHRQALAEAIVAALHEEDMHIQHGECVLAPEAELAVWHMLAKSGCSLDESRAFHSDSGGAAN